MTDIAADRARLLQIVRDKAIVHGRVTLSSGREADYYVDLRRITLDGEASSLVGRADLDASQVEELRATIVGSGAVARLEDEITRLADAATSALGDATSIGDEARAALLDLVGITTARTA